MKINTAHLCFRIVPQGPIVLALRGLRCHLTIRLRRQVIFGERHGGFIDLIVAGRIICCGLGRSLFRGTVRPPISAEVVSQPIQEVFDMIA